MPSDPTDSNSVGLRANTTMGEPTRHVTENEERVAYENGFAAALAGATEDICAYFPFTQLALAWLRGFEAGRLRLSVQAREAIR